MILKNCIFGIDIDSFSCDITRLVLFLISGKTDHFDNILCGNFLIENLEGYSCNLDFSRIFKNYFDGFSLIIGNPPYLNIQNIDKTEKSYYMEHFDSAFRRFDICLLFIEKSLEKLLKPGGLMAFIVPDKILTQSYAKKLRHLILNKHAIKELIGFKNPYLFKKASVIPIIIVVENGRFNKIGVKTTEVFANTEKITYVNQDIYKNMYNFSFRIGWNINKQDIIEIIQEKSFPLYELCYVSWGAQPGDASKFIFNNPNQVNEELRPHLKPLIRGGNISRYSVSYTGDYLLYLTEGDLKLHRPAFNELFNSEKIVIAEVTANKGIIAGIDNEKLYTNHSIINCIHKKDIFNLDSNILSSRGIKLIEAEADFQKYKWQETQYAYTRGTVITRDSRFNNIDLKYAISLINSKLVNFYFKNFLTGGLNVFPELVRFFPVFDIDLQHCNEHETDYFRYCINTNDFESAEILLTEQIHMKDYSKIHAYLSLIASRLIELKHNLFLPQFTLLDSMLDNAVYNLYGLNKSQIDYIEENT